MTEPAPAPAPHEILAATAEGDFRVAWELPEHERLRLADGGAGVQVATYERMVREAGQALAGIVTMQCDRVGSMRDQLLAYLAELDAGDDLETGSEEEDGASGAGGRSDAGSPARSAEDHHHDEKTGGRE